MTEATAEDALRALARDLIEEISAGRVVALSEELDEDDILELGTFNVRPFSRQQRTKTGRVITEEVRGHVATRDMLAHPGSMAKEGGGLPHPGAYAHYVQGEPGHMAFGIPEASWEANEWKKRAGAISKIHQGIEVTRKSISPRESRPGSGSYSHDIDSGTHAFQQARSHGYQAQQDRDVSQHLANAQEHLKTAGTPAGSHPDEHGTHLANAYHELAEAHRITTEHVLPAARSGKQRAEINDALKQVKGHMEGLDKLTGSSGEATRKLTEVPTWDRKRAKAVEKLSGDIGKTVERFQPPPLSKASKNISDASQLLGRHGSSYQHLTEAQRALASAHGGDAQALTRAYHALSEAHRTGVEDVLARAHDPQVAQEVHQHIDTIQAHMEALDKIAGTSPEMTRKIIGTSAQHNERAKAVQEEAKLAAERAAARGEHFEHGGLLNPEQDTAVRQQASDVQAEKAHQAALNEAHAKGFAPGDAVKLRQWNRMQGQHTIDGTITDIGPDPYAYKGGGFRARDSEPMAKVDIGNGVVKDAYLSDLIAAEPQYPKGAQAVHPQVGAFPRQVMPGGTISGHHLTGRAAPMALPPAEPVPAGAAELEAANQKIAQLTQRAAARTQQDLKDHMAAINAMEAARLGMAVPGQYTPLTDEQFALRRDFVARQVEEALRRGMATDQAHSLDGNGQVWSPQRALQHAEILADFLDRQLDVPSQKEALFMGGLPGAGKSTLMKHHPDISLSDYAVLNPDDFKEELARRGMVPEVEGLSPMEAAALVHEESAYLTDLAAAELERRGKNVAWDVTMKNQGVTEPRVQALKDKGYAVRGIFVDVPVEKSAQRVEKRYRKGLEAYREGKNTLGGRYIPRDVILAGESAPGVSRARVTFEHLKHEFHAWEYYSGTEGMPQLVESSQSIPATSGIPSVEALRRLIGGPSVLEQQDKQTTASMREAGFNVPEKPLSQLAIMKYQDAGNRMNRMLRGQENPENVTPDVAEASRLMDHMTRNAPPLERDTVVWRGTPGNNQRGEGDIFTNKHFTSTTTDRSIAEQDFKRGGNGQLLRITLPAGTPALVMRNVIGPRDVEKEVLVHPGAQFHVTKVDPSGVVHVVYVGGTEQAARGAETGQSAKQIAGLTQTNPGDNMGAEEELA